MPGNRRLYIVWAGSILTGAALLAARPAVQGPETGSIAGEVRLSGSAAVDQRVVTTDERYCGSEVPSEAIVAGSDGGLLNSVVYLEGLQHNGGSANTVLRLDNEGCAFVPHVQAGMAGSRLEVTNADPIMHNTHLFLQYGSRSRSLLNMALPTAGVRLDASRGARWPGVIEVRCDVHQWMSAYILLFEHPYYAVTDSLGRFRIEGVPVGTYTVKVWHETLGELEDEVKVEPDKTASIAFLFGE